MLSDNIKLNRGKDSKSMPLLTAIGMQKFTQISSTDQVKPYLKRKSNLYLVKISPRDVQPSLWKPIGPIKLRARVTKSAEISL